MYQILKIKIDMYCLCFMLHKHITRIKWMYNDGFIMLYFPSENENKVKKSNTIKLYIISV